MSSFRYANTRFNVEKTTQEESLRCAFRDAKNKLVLELVLYPNEKSAALTHLKKSQTCSGTFVFKMGLKFAKQAMKTCFVMHVWDGSVVDNVHLGILNLLRNKPTYYERFGFEFFDQEAIQRAKSRANFLASQNMQELHQACSDLQEGATSYVAKYVAMHLKRTRCKTFGQFVRKANLSVLCDLFDLSDLAGRSTTFFGLLFDLKLSYPSQLFLEVDF